MKTWTKLAFGVLAAGLVGVASNAEAKLTGTPKLLTDFGMSAMIGGGVTGFTDPDVVDMADAGGSWTARLILGTRLPIGFEAAYVGSAQDIRALNLDSSAVLVSSGLEGAVRLNILTEEWQPYLFAGLAYKHYDLVNEDFNTSSVKNADDVGEVPLGIGLAYRYEGFVADARLAFNPAFDSDLIPAVSGNNLDLNTWNMNLRLGWEF